MEGEEPPTVRPKGNQQAHQPGSKNYHGHKAKHYDSVQNGWAGTARSMNNSDSNRRAMGRAGQYVVGAAAAPVVMGAAAVPLQNRMIRDKTKAMNAKSAAVGKGLKLKNPFRIHPKGGVFNEAEHGMRDARTSGKVHNVTSMSRPAQHPSDYQKPPMERLGESAMKHKENGGDPLGSAFAAGSIGGGLLLTGGTMRARREQDVAAKRYRRRPRKTVAKSGLKLGQQLGSPRKVAATLRSNPQLLAFGGAGATAAGVQHPAVERHLNARANRGKDVGTAAVTGAIGGQAVYQGVTHVSNHVASTNHSKKTYKDPARRRGYLDPEQKKLIEGHKKKHGLSDPKVKSDYKGYWRSMPNEAHSGKHLRINAKLTTGKRGVALGTAVTAAGALASMKALGPAKKAPVDKLWKPRFKARARSKVEAGLRAVIEPIDKPIVHHTMRAAVVGGAAGGAFGAGATGLMVAHRRPVAKALYAQERRPSLLRYAELGIGAGVGAWGLGRSGMLGAALGRGVKMATRSGNTSALEALRMAQATQGVLRSATAPGERAVRQIKALNTAINAVPRHLRPEVAAAAGIYLTANSHPINRTHYRPVSTDFRRAY